jgi:hypothetical protein
LAQRDWKKAVEDALEHLGDRVRDVLGTLEGLLSPPPEPVRVPVGPPRPARAPRRR